MTKKRTATIRRGALALALILGTAAVGRAGRVELVSRVQPTLVSDTGSGGNPSLGPPPSLSADGRYVAFLSEADNLVPGQEDAKGEPDVFLRDRVAGTTTLVSRTAVSATATVAESSQQAAVSPDGRYVAWVSQSFVAVPVPSGGLGFLPSNLFLFDRVAGTNTQIAVTRALDTVGFRGRPVFSGDGRYLAFVSDAPDLVPGQVDENRSADAFLYDLAARSLTLVSHRSGSHLAAAGASNWNLTISRDGHVAFVGDEGLALFDPGSGAVEVIAGVAGESRTYPAISADGRYVAFASAATSLVPGQIDGNGGEDAFLYDRATRTFTLASRSLVSPATAANRPLGLQSLTVSGDGRYVAFESTATDVVPGQGGVPLDIPLKNVLVFDRITATVSLAAESVSDSPGDEAYSPSSTPKATPSPSPPAPAADPSRPLSLSKTSSSTTRPPASARW